MALETLNSIGAAVQYLVIDGNDKVGGLVECELSHVHMLKAYHKLAESGATNLRKYTFIPYVKRVVSGRVPDEH